MAHIWRENGWVKAAIEWCRTVGSARFVREPRPRAACVVAGKELRLPGVVNPPPAGRYSTVSDCPNRLRTAEHVLAGLCAAALLAAFDSVPVGFSDAVVASAWIGRAIKAEDAASAKINSAFFTTTSLRPLRASHHHSEKPFATLARRQEA